MNWVTPNSKVLAYHGPLIYEAKVMKVHEKNKYYVENLEGRQEPLSETDFPMDLLKDDAYLLHYKGWKLKWDEWVGNTRVMEYNDHNLKVKKEVYAKFREQFKKPTTPQPQTNGSSTKTEGKGGSKRKSAAKQEIKPKRKKLDIILPMPDKLKYLLVDDWEFVTKDRKIISLPVEKPISVILKEYAEYKAANDTLPEDLNVSNEIQTGILAYFNQAVRLILLYKYERLQYGNLIKENGSDIDLCEYYGMEHLLRLFVSLPGLVGQTSMESPSITVMMNHVKQILMYLEQNYDSYLNNYDDTSPAYDSLTRS